jgi:hypothetical protein
MGICELVPAGSENTQNFPLKKENDHLTIGRKLENFYTLNLILYIPKILCIITYT